MKSRIATPFYIFAFLLPFVYIPSLYVFSSAKYFFVSLFCILILPYIYFRIQLRPVERRNIYFLFAIITLTLIHTILLDGKPHEYIKLLTILCYSIVLITIIRYIDRKAILKSIYFSSALLSFFTLLEAFGITFNRGVSELFSYHHFPVIMSLGNPNDIATFLLITLPIGIYFSFKSSKSIYILTNSLLISAIYVTYSRLAWIITALILLLYTVIVIYKSLKVKPFYLRQLSVIILSALLIIVVNKMSPYTASVEKADKRISSITPAGNKKNAISGRLFINKINLEMIRDNPVYGSGIGNYQDEWLAAQGRYFKNRNNKSESIYCSNLEHAHNDLFEFSITFGVIIVLILLIFIFYILFSRLKFIWQFDLLPIYLSLLILIAVSFVYSPLQKLLTQVIFVIYLIIICSVNNKHTLVKDNRRSIKQIYLFIGTGIMSFAVLAGNLCFMSSEILYQKAKQHYISGEHEKALTVLENIPVPNSLYGKQSYLLGLCYISLNQNNKAIKNLKASWNTYKNIDVLVNLSEAYSNVKDYENALSINNLILRYFPFYKEIYNNSGIIYIQTSQFDKALLYFNTALDIDPNYYFAKYNKEHLLELLNTQ